MRAALVDLNAELERDYGTTLELRIGVNSGEVVTGTDERLVTGDAINVAARLEQTARPGQVLLGEATLLLTREAVEAVPLEPLELKGKSDLVRAWRLVSVSSEASERRPDSPLIGRKPELRSSSREENLRFPSRTHPSLRNLTVPLPEPIPPSAPDIAVTRVALDGKNKRA